MFKTKSPTPLCLGQKSEKKRERELSARNALSVQEARKKEEGRKGGFLGAKSDFLLAFEGFKGKC